MPPPISLRWLECVDDELSPLAVKVLSLTGFVDQLEGRKAGMTGHLFQT